MSLYSNTGYDFLGRVVEKLSGKSYEQFVQEFILSPLNITSTFIGNANGTSRYFHIFIQEYKVESKITSFALMSLEFRLL